MFSFTETIKVGQLVAIPTSELGKNGNIGKVISKWGDKIMVEFDGHLGQYTIENHTIFVYPEGTLIENFRI